MLFFQFYDHDHIAVNLSLLISLLSDDEQKSLLKEILTLWSDDNSIMKISFQQHFYLSKMLLLVFFNLKTEIKDVFFLGDNLSLILTGIYLHLSQVTNNYRLIGMVVAEVLSKYCSYQSSDPLNFQYVDTEETKILKNLINIQLSETIVPTFMAENIPVERNIDSDESDFEPIESIFDEEIIHTKRPFYVRDCFEGISNTKPEERDYFTVCLASAADLIGRCPAASIEQSVEFSRQLLHLHIEYEVDNFTEQQRNALVALCCLDPLKVSTYLIGELFSEHNGIGIRYTVLFVITRTAQSLSGFNDFLQPIGNNIATETREIATETINKNSKRKTRYFFKRNRRSIVETRNLFNEFSSHFFYQLLIGGNPIGGNPISGNSIGGFDLFVDNIDLLSRYVYTLAIVVYCSAQCASGFNTMMKEFLLFLKSLRSHERIDIRTAVQVCFGIGLIALSGADSTSIDDSVEHLTEWHLWLNSAYEQARYDYTDYSSLIEKNLFLMRDLAADVANSLLSMTF